MRATVEFNSYNLEATMKKKRVVVLVTAVLVFAGLSSAQAPTQKPPSAMVYIPVNVTGPKNVQVSGLKKENFVLLEDRIEQTISVFYPENSPIDLDIILALSSLQRGRTDLVSVKVREAIENFRHQGNSQNKYVVEEMPFGANGIFDAMSRHVTRLAQNSINPRKLVLVITDGFEASGGEPARTLQEYAKKFDVPIYIVFAAHAGTDTSDDILEVARGQKIYLSGGAGYEDLANYTGGRMYQAEADTQLGPFLETLAKELRSQYVLGFRSTNDARDDKWRNIEVKIKAPNGIGEIKEKDMKPKARDRYFVAKVK
jgi:Ca-activated chloride channel family protein